MIDKKILEQLNILESIKESGNVAMIKFDGERKENQITVVVSFSQNSEKDVIQYHGDDLHTLLDRLIKDYELKNGL